MGKRRYNSCSSKIVSQSSSEEPYEKLLEKCNNLESLFEQLIEECNEKKSTFNELQKSSDVNRAPVSSDSSNNTNTIFIDYNDLPKFEAKVPASNPLLRKSS